MEDGVKFVVLDRAAAEDRFLQGRSSTPQSTRRLSAAGKAAVLKGRNLIPPLNSPTDRRISLPRATKAPRNTEPEMPTNDKRKPAPKGDSGEDKPSDNTVPSPTPTPTEKFIQEQLAALTSMISSVKADIGRAETRTVEKIDSKVDDLAGKLEARMSKAKTDLSRLGSEVASTRKNLEDLRLTTAEREKSIPKLIEEAVTARLAARDPGTSRRPRPLVESTPRPPQTQKSQAHEEKYWVARHTLRVWPVPGEDRELKSAFLEFLASKLLCPPGRVAQADFEVKRAYSPPEMTAQNQVIVTFASIALRDEIKSMARNLRGADRSVGVQIEPPDSLRSHYQAFQRLAFQLKRKNPALKRNVKFSDYDLCLVMDVKINSESEWKTIMYDQARQIIKKTRARTESFSLEELETMANVGRGQKKRRRETLSDSESDEDLDSTIIDLTENETKNKQRKPSRRLCFINTNARSLGPKVESLYDCFAEKEVDLAFLTETWYQSDRSLSEKLAEYSSRFSLQALVRNRQDLAANGRSYGGVAFVYRERTAKFENFELVNPDNHEVLATIGSVSGIKGKNFCLTVYAPPNLTQLKARQLLEYLSDLVGEAKRKFANCSIVIGGDFNQWPIEEISQDHPDLTEVKHGPTRGDREIDRTFVNFGRSIRESGALPP